MRKFGLTQFAMLAPALGLLVFIILLPSLYVFWLSFTESTYGKAPVFVGLENYIAIWNDRYFWRALVNTLIVVNVIVYGELILAFVIASVLVKGVPFRRLILAIVLMPYAISEVVAVVIWKFLLDPDIGALAKAMAGAGLPDINWATNPTHGLGLVSLISIWLNLPFTLIIIYAAMLAVPRDLYESAKIDGANPGKSFRYVTCRRSSGGVCRADLSLHHLVPAVQRGLAADRRRPGPHHRSDGDLSLQTEFYLCLVRQGIGDRMGDGDGVGPDCGSLPAFAVPARISTECVNACVD